MHFTCISKAKNTRGKTKSFELLKSLIIYTVSPNSHKSQFSGDELVIICYCWNRGTELHTFSLLSPPLQYTNERPKIKASKPPKTPDKCNKTNNSRSIPPGEPLLSLQSSDHCITLWASDVMIMLFILWLYLFV